MTAQTITQSLTEAHDLLRGLHPGDIVVDAEQTAMQAQYEGPEAALILRSAAMPDIAWNVDDPAQLAELLTARPFALVWSPGQVGTIERIRREVLDYVTPRVEDPDNYGDPRGFMLGEVKDKLDAILGG